MEIKPVQTKYNGYLFRSRLEARWAMFFDACGVRYEYEPEGFDLGDGIYYLPDFLLHGVVGRVEGDLYVEVKGRMTSSDVNKIVRFAVGDSFGLGGPNWKVENKIYVVNSIPNGNNIIDILNYAEQEECEELGVKYFNYEYIDGDYWTGIPACCNDGTFQIIDMCHINEIDGKRTLNAYEKARQARFEKGAI